jgi:hypothetical protein
MEQHENQWPFVFDGFQLRQQWIFVIVHRGDLLKANLASLEAPLIYVNNPVEALGLFVRVF